MGLLLVYILLLIFGAWILGMSGMKLGAED